MPHEIFISYSCKDKSIAEAIRTALEDSSIPCWIAPRDILPGTNWSEACTNALNESSILILVLSSSAIESRPVISEVELAFCQNLYLIPYKVENVELVPRIKMFIQGSQCFDASAPPAERRIEELVSCVKNLRDARPAVTEDSADGLRNRVASGGLCNVPEGNPLFTGREQVLERLRQKLVDHQRVALVGLPGVGKTQTAVEYACQNKRLYSLLLWANASTRDALFKDFGIIAQHLGLPERNEQDQNVVTAAVKRWLNNNRGWLLILDNAEDLALARQFAPFCENGQILLTRRAHAVGGVIHRMDIGQMSWQEGAYLILRRAGMVGEGEPLESATREDRTAALAIADKVDGLPLALTQAGAFMDQTAATPAEYLSLYEADGEIMRRTPDDVYDNESVTTTFTLAFQKLGADNAAAADLLRLCAFLSPDLIPEELLIKGAQALDEDLRRAITDRHELERLIKAALNLALLQRGFTARRGVSIRGLSIHRLIQDVLRDGMDSDTRRVWAERAVRVVSTAFQFPEYSYWPICDLALPHAVWCAELIREWGMEFAEAGYLLHNAGYYLKERARYDEAERLLPRALTVLEKALGSEHLAVAKCLNTIASVYSTRCRYARAESHLLRSLQIREKARGKEHPDVISSLIGLATLCFRRGQYPDAESYYARALNIGEKSLGSDDSTVARILNGMAELYCNLGRHEEAEQHFQRALSIRDKALGVNSPDTAWSLHGMAVNYVKMRQYDKAEPLYKQALEIWEAALGSEHPCVARGLNELAELYCERGRHQDAEPLFRTALEKREKVLGPEHYDLAWSLEGLAEVKSRQGDEQAAEQLLRRALDIREKTLEPQHPHVALSLNNLAALYLAQGRCAQAEPLLLRALEIRERSLGAEHYDTHLSREMLMTLREQARYATNSR